MKHCFFLLLLCLYFYKVDAQETAYSKEATALWRKTVNDLQYSVLQREFKSSFSFNPDTKKYDIPNFYVVEYYYNTNTEPSSSKTKMGIKTQKEMIAITCSYAVPS